MVTTDSAVSILPNYLYTLIFATIWATFPVSKGKTLKLCHSLQYACWRRGGEERGEQSDCNGLGGSIWKILQAGRVGVPEDIAELTVFLLDRRASFITGQAFVADGGMTKKMIYAE